MVTVHRAYGFRFVMFANDHAPPHVHVFGQGGEAKINLEAPNEVRLEWTVGINRNDLRKIVEEAQRLEPELRRAWRKIHGQ
jgi:hypothetical protein